MRIKLAEVAPHIDPMLVIATGASSLRTVFQGDDLQAVLVAYMWGIKIAFAMAVAGIGLSVFIGAATRWTKLNTQKIQGAGAA